MSLKARHDHFSDVTKTTCCFIYFLALFLQLIGHVRLVCIVFMGLESIISTWRK